MPHISYFWDEMEDNVVEEYDGDTGNTIAAYTTEPTQYGSVLSQNRGGEKRAFQFDGLGNTTELTDGTGNVTDERRYSAFGETVVTTGSTSMPFQYGGRWGYHASGGVPVSIRRRQYEPSRIRWTSSDPLGVVVLNGASLYAFLANSPFVNADPSGLCRLYVQCWREWYGRHCGLALRYEGPAGLSSVYAIDATQFNGTVWFKEFRGTADKPALYDDNKVEIAGMTDSMCDCLHSSITLWSRLRLQYRAASHNSNYAMKCLAKRCGISIPAYGQAWGFTSNYKCVKWDLIPEGQDATGIQYDICECTKWQECPTGFDQWESGLATSEPGRR